MRHIGQHLYDFGLFSTGHPDNPYSRHVGHRPSHILDDGSWRHIFHASGLISQTRVDLVDVFDKSTYHYLLYYYLWDKNI